MLHEAIRLSLETKLNNNTANKRFVVGSFAKTDDSEKDFIYNVQNGYMVVETNYIPVMMTWTSAYQAMPGQINGNAKIGLQLLVLADPERTDAEFQADLATLEEVVPQIVGNFEKASLTAQKRIRRFGTWTRFNRRERLRSTATSTSTSFRRFMLISATRTRMATSFNTTSTKRALNRIA